MEQQRTKIAYVFPGQGSQSVGMGLEIYQSSPAVRDVFEEADSVVGMPLSQLCFYGPDDELSQTINAQPAILTASVAYLRAIAEAGEASFIKPSFVAGHSVGEYTALVAAQVLDFPDAVRLIRERARLMQEAGESTPGGMTAILGLDESTVEEICQETGTHISNVNSCEQIVVSGTKEALARSSELAMARGARRVIPIKASGAFHSPLMQCAEEGMAKAISQTSFYRPAILIVANGQLLTTAEEVKAELLCHLTRCVQWTRTVEYMLESGVSTFVEIGPGRVLSGLIQRINKDVQTVNIGDTASIEAMEP